ncbi:hypothetical protein M673_24095 (plasmid) [Aureimonas sp. AU20]|nr:hypothetical protein M673_24095 [Aureimonas sp. AU20]
MGRGVDPISHFIGDMTNEEFTRTYRVHERRAFVEREAIVRGMTPEALEAEMWEHFADANYPHPIWIGGKLDWPLWRTHDGRDPWAR